jgi:hypothetical protein
MSVIITGNFPTKSRAEIATAELVASGVRRDSICIYALNAPGQHATFPVGGDHDVSAGAHHAGRDTAAGAAIGGVVGAGAGAAASMVLGPVAVVGGAAVGAYIGSLAGALQGLGADQPDDVADEDTVQPAGALVAVNAPATDEQDRVTHILYAQGARRVDTKQGIWEQGAWTDMDPSAL